MINKVLVRIMYALFFGGMVAYVAQGLFHDGWVSAGFGVATVVVIGLWNLRRATMPRDRRLGSSGTRISRFLATRAGLAIVFGALALVLALAVFIEVSGHACPPSPGPTNCALPSHMNW